MVQKELTVGSSSIAPTFHFAYSLFIPSFQVGDLAQLATLPERFSGPAARRYPRCQAALLVVLIGLLYSSILYYLIGLWWSIANFSPGFFLSFFSLFVLS